MPRFCTDRRNVAPEGCRRPSARQKLTSRVAHDKRKRRRDRYNISVILVAVRLFLTILQLIDHSDLIFTNMFSRHVLSRLLLFLAYTSALFSSFSLCPELWQKSFLVTDNQCPRFVYVRTGIEHGLGDQLERLFLAMSIIYGKVMSQTFV